MTPQISTGRKAAVVFILITAMLDVMTMGIVIPVLPALIEEFAGTQANAGWINGIFVALWAGMQFLVSPAIGTLSDRIGRRPVILVSTAGLAADYVLIALAPNLWWLALGRILSGMTSASFTTVYAYLADITPPEGRARAYGLVGAAFSAGFVAGPLIGGTLGEFSPRTPFWFAAVLSGLAFLYGFFILPESLPRRQRTRFSWRRANPFGAMRLLGSQLELGWLATINFLLHFAHHVLSALFVLYATHRYGLGPGQTGLLLALAGGLNVAVQGLFVGPIAGHLGNRYTMILGLLGGAAGLVMMGLAPNTLVFMLGLLPYALWGLAMPTLQSQMTQLVSEREQGQLQGAVMSVASIAGVISPLFFGGIYALTMVEGSALPMPGLAFLLAACALLCAALIGYGIARRKAAVAS